MTADEIEILLKVASKVGIKSVKFTGGEPLLREDILNIVARASKYMHDVSITTNGTLLALMAKELKAAGLNRINISLDTVDRKKYEEITGEDMLNEVVNGIKEAVAAGLKPVKVNIVAVLPLKEIMETVKTIWKLGAMPQIIEMVNIGKRGSNDISHIETYIASKAIKIKQRHMHRRNIYTLLDDEGNEREIEVVRPIHNSAFCAACTRLRITSDGKLKPCLMHNNGLVDVITPIRKGATMEEIILLFEKAVENRYPYWR
jgi:cyclic pyranopterin phosphate synthase